MVCFPIVLIGFALNLAYSTSSQDTENDCPFHLCTPERLGCPSSRLLTNDKGCMLCKCEESIAPSRNCHLHGCTVELLECKSSKLKQSPEGCTLCECEDIVTSTTVLLDVGSSSSIDPLTGSPVNSQLPIAPEIGRKDTLGLRPGVDGTATAPIACKPVACTSESLGCDMLATNPMTGCTICACAENPSISGLYLRSIDDDLSVDVNEPDIENPCPDPRELLQSEGVSLGTNTIGKAAKYRLSIGKLKKGFQPGEKYKIHLQKHDDAEPFRAFLFEVKPAMNAVNKRSRPNASPDEPTGNSSASDSENGSELCGAGYLLDTGNGTNGVRAIPHCRSSGLEGDGQSNKTKVMVEWVAPTCGCVTIRAAVVDHSDQVVYMDPTLSSPSLERPKSKKPSSANNRPLFWTVCAKNAVPPSKRKDKNNKGSGGNLPSWIVSDCCLAGIPKTTSHKGKASKAALCERDSILYSTAEYFSYRFSVIRRTCRKAYKKCCVMAQEFDIGNGNNKGSKSKVGLPRTKPDLAEKTTVPLGQIPSAAKDKSAGKGKRNRKQGNKKRRKKKHKSKGKKSKDRTGKNKKGKKSDRKKRIKRKKNRRDEEAQ